MFGFQRRPQPATQADVSKILAEIGGLAFEVQNLIKVIMALSDNITQLQADVSAETSAVQSAVTLLGSLKSELDAALAAAAAAGATTDQLQALTDLSTTLEANTTSLANAVAANTPAAPTPPAP